MIKIAPTTILFHCAFRLGRSELAGEELCLAVAERPVLVGVLNEVDHHVGREDAALTTEVGAEPSVEVGLFLACPGASGDLHENHFIGALEPEAGVFDADAAALMLVDDLIAIADGHMESVQHCPVSDIKQFYELLLITAFYEVKAEKGHRCVPLC